LRYFALKQPNAGANPFDCPAAPTTTDILLSFQHLMTLPTTFCNRFCSATRHSSVGRTEKKQEPPNVLTNIQIVVDKLANGQTTPHQALNRCMFVLASNPTHH